MARLRAVDMAKELVEDDYVFLLAETEKYEYYIVKGTQREKYDIIFHKIEGIYTCDCKNIRLTPCKHIYAVQIYKGEVTNVH